MKSSDCGLKLNKSGVQWTRWMNRWSFTILCSPQSSFCAIIQKSTRKILLDFCGGNQCDANFPEADTKYTNVPAALYEVQCKTTTPQTTALQMFIGYIFLTIPLSKMGFVAGRLQWVAAGYETGKSVYSTNQYCAIACFLHYGFTYVEFNQQDIFFNWQIQSLDNTRPAQNIQDFHIYT